MQKVMNSTSTKNYFKGIFMIYGENNPADGMFIVEREGDENWNSWFE